jgi:hypothetical protein
MRIITRSFNQHCRDELLIEESDQPTTPLGVLANPTLGREKKKVQKIICF